MNLKMVFRLIGLVLLGFCLVSSTAATTSSSASQASLSQSSRFFPETGQSVSGRFLDYWQSHGGLAQQGYPISPEIEERSETDGKTYTVQYFERAVFELHPENAAPHDVLLSLLGVFEYEQKYGAAGAPNQKVSTYNPRKFAETGKTVGGKFRSYWEKNGGLAQQGFPISEEFQERSTLDGKTYTVQYFERAVFELHLENNAPYDVLLSQLGKFRYDSAHSSTTSAITDLEPSFPINLGEATIGSGRGMLVGNIDADSALEIVVKALSVDPIYKQLLAYEADGSMVHGWPINDATGDFALGNLSASYPGFEIFTRVVTYTAENGSAFLAKTAYSGSGATLPGWPVGRERNQAGLPSLGDVDGDGLDEIFQSHDSQLYAFKANGSTLPGWPVLGYGATFGDLDSDGSRDIVVIGSTTLVRVYHQDGTLLRGFPVPYPPGQATHVYSPVIGDVDGDGALEIVTVTAEVDSPRRLFLRIVSSQGVIKRTMPLTGGLQLPALLTLGDLDCDGFPEIIVQTSDSIHAFKGDGTVLSGWPKTWGEIAYDRSGPVIGDVDGDGGPDIVTIVAQGPGKGDQEIHAYDAKGQMLKGFPKVLSLGRGSIAIADIDVDGRNEIIAMSDKNVHFIGEPNELWVFDLHGQGSYGSVQWGQYKGGPQHQGYYDPGKGGCKAQLR